MHPIPISRGVVYAGDTMNNTLTRTQVAALLHFAGKAPLTIQSNHYLRGISACVKKGLISCKYEGIYVREELTEAGRACVAELYAK